MTKTVSKTRRTTRPTSAKAATGSSISPMMIGIVIGVVVLVVGGLIVLGNLGNQPASVDISKYPVLGEATAPVTLLGYSDYRCPHCRDFDLEKLPQIEAEYINTGKVKYVVAPFHLWPETSILTEAAMCAGDQDKFFEYSQKLFENQDGLGLTPSYLADQAEGVGLNRNTFSECLANGTHKGLVDEATRAALNRGVTSTPTFFINDQRVNGNVSFEQFKGIFEQELAKVQ